MDNFKLSEKVKIEKKVLRVIMAKKKKLTIVDGETICSSKCLHCVYGRLSEDKKRVICSHQNKIFIYGQKVVCSK